MSEKETGNMSTAVAVPPPSVADEAPESGPVARPAAGDPAMAQLLELFDGPLRHVVFPDVSRDALRALADDSEVALAERAMRAAALTEAEEVMALAEAAVAEARAALRDAEAQVDEKQRALLARGQRALSYAKVFAETDPDLHARLSSISLARISQRGRPVGPGASRVEARPASGAPVAVDGRKRGRPRKTRSELEAVALEAT